MPHPVDKIVGSRIRQARWFKGMTQSQLGEVAGCKFQQIQKYETAANRISASRLWEVARALDRPLSYFFESESLPEAPASPSVDRMTAEMLHIFSSLTEAEQKALLSLARSMSK